MKDLLTEFLRRKRMSMVRDLKRMVEAYCVMGAGPVDYTGGFAKPERLLVIV